MAASTLESSLIEWLAKFNKNGLPCSSLSDLYDGDLISTFVNDYLCEADLLPSPPRTQEWLVMKEFWITVLNKLSRFIVKYMGSVYNTVEEQLDALLSEVDTEQLSRRASTAPLLVLLELVLMSSMHCKLKENCVFQVLQLRKDQQAAMMSSIQVWKSKFKKSAPRASSTASSSKASPEDEYKERYTSMKASHDQLQAQIQSIQRTQSAMAARNSELVTLVTQLESQLGSVTSDYKQARAHILDLESKQVLTSSEQLDLASPARFVASSKVAADENAQLRATIAIQEKNAASLQAQVASLSQYVSKVRELQDEVEMWKEKSRSAEQVERVNRKFEAKSTELVNALAKVKQLEDQLETTAKQSAEFESIAKQVPQLKSKLDQYKAEIVSLHSKMTETSMNQGSHAEDVKMMKDKLQAYELQAEQHASIVSALEKEKETLVQAMRSRPVMNSKISSGTLMVPSNSSASSASANVSSTSETKVSLGQQLGRGKAADTAAVAQLEKELVAARDDAASVKMDLEDRLDTMSLLKDKFQSDYMASSDQIRQLKSEKATLEESVARCTAENNTLVSTLSEMKTKVATLESKVQELQHGKREVEALLAKSNTALQAVENAAVSEKEHHSSQLKQVQQKLAQSVEEARRLSAESEFVKKELEGARNDLESLSMEAATHQDQCLELSTELDEVKHEKSSLSGQLANMEMEMKTLEETLQDYMDRELSAVEASLTLKNEVQNLTSLVESRDAELTVMQQELDKAKQNEELINVITALRNQVITQTKKINMLKEEQRTIISSYHALGMELLQLKIGGLPQPTTKNSESSSTIALPFPSSKSFIPKTSNTPGKSTPSKRVPLKEKNLNQIPPLGQIPASHCTDANHKNRRISMAQRALETRPRNSLAAGHVLKS